MKWVLGALQGLLVFLPSRWRWFVETCEYNVYNILMIFCLLEVSRLDFGLQYSMEGVFLAGEDHIVLFIGDT